MIEGILGVGVTNSSEASWKTLTTGQRLCFMSLLVFMGGAWGLQFSTLKLATLNGYSEITVLMIALVLISLFCIILLVLRRGFFRVTYERLVAFLVLS